MHFYLTISWSTLYLSLQTITNLFDHQCQTYAGQNKCSLRMLRVLIQRIKAFARKADDSASGFNIRGGLMSYPVLFRVVSFFICWL